MGLFFIFLGLGAVIVSLAWIVILFGRMVLFAVPMLHGPVYVPSSDDRLQTMLELAKIKTQDKIIDIGSGDGKIVFALAEQGHNATGVDINWWLVWRARARARHKKLTSKTTFIRGNFWNVDFSKYDVLFLYGTTYIMKKLEKKLQAELKPGARVVSNYFKFPNWKPAQEKNQVRLYIKK